MTYHVARGGTQLGQFSEEQIRAGLRDGSILSGDLVWREGMAEWRPASEILGSEPLNAPVVPPPIPQKPQEGASGLAIASLVLGILSFIAICFTGLPAIICGHMALGRIRRSGGILGGKGLAIAGLVMGYLTTGISLVAILASLAVPTFSKIQERGNQTKAMNNARQIIIALRLYAADNDGKYPDELGGGSTAPDSNTAFRRLFTGGMIDEERPFGCPTSSYVPDGNIGTAPDYQKALEPGENHWAMTKGWSDAQPGVVPFVYENTASSADWPPTWNTKARGHFSPGSSWSGGKIIIGFSDGSVSVVRLETGLSDLAAPLPKPDGAPVFPPGSGNLSVLNPR